MPIKSYLAHPHSGKKLELINSLSVMNQCTVCPAENQDIVAIVTDTNTKEEEELLREELESLESLKLLVMVSGFDVPSKKEKL